MNNFKSIIVNYTEKRDEWIFLALAIAVSLFQLQDGSWTSYMQLLLSNIVWLSPIIIYKILQSTYINKPILKPLKRGWLGAFVFYPAIILLALISPINSKLIDFHTVAMMVFFATLLELALHFKQWFSRFQLNSNILNRIGLSEVLLGAILCISVYLAMLVASDLPQWRQSNSVQDSIDFTGVLSHPLLTIWLSIQFFLLFFCGYIFYWLNQHVLIKYVLKTRGFFIYCIAAIATVLALYPVLMTLYLMLPINHMGEPIIPAVTANPFDFANARVFLAVMFLSLPVILVIRWHQQNSTLISLEKDKVQTELRLLKQQIDPHFFLNTLNNLYALTRKKSDQAPDVVMQLAQLMQYVVYRGQEKQVLISEEAEYVQDYINLQSLRFNDQLTIDMSVEINDKSAMISPLLLVILVENAFKHGVEQATQESWLKIKLIESNGTLIFQCENSIEHAEVKSPNLHGVGIDNLKRRLTLLYPKRHKITLNQYEKAFSAVLEIRLSEMVIGAALHD